MFFLLAAAMAACDRPVSNGELARMANQALVLQEKYDIDSFLDLAANIETQLPCAAEPIDRSIVVRLHLVVGFQLWDDLPRMSRHRAALAWVAARGAQPEYKVSRELFPPTEAWYRVWEGLSGKAGPHRPLPAGTIWWVDGVATQQLPTDRPAVVQSLGSDGKVLRTAYAWPESAWPPVVQPSAVQAPVVQAPAVQPPDPPHRPRIAPLVTGALSLAIAGTGGALAASAYDRSKHENFLLQCPNYWRDGSCPQMGNPEFQGWYKNSFVPAWLGGLTMVGVGVAGLAGSSIWLVAGPSSVQVGGDF